jgi:uncharacterized protein (DUF952 family)
MSEIVYKIARAAEWEDAQTTGVFAGSRDDKRDGFIHLASASQVSTTSDIHFSDEDNLLLVAIEVNALGPALKWEPSRRGENFPHLYAPLPLSLVHAVTPIRRGADGRLIFPPEIP